MITSPWVDQLGALVDHLRAPRQRSDGLTTARDGVILMPEVVMPAPAVALVERVRQFAMLQGAVECRGTWIRQEGEMRFAPDRPWLPFEAEQWFEGPGIDFRWRARVRMAPLVRARVVDSFENGRGALVARVLGVIPVARASGAATDVAEALRGLAELPWRPAAFARGSCLAFEAVSEERLRATFDDGKTQAMVEFDLGGDGRVLRGRATSRPRLVGKMVVHTPWSGTFDNYQMFDGVRVPTSAEVTWHMPEGPFTYWRGRVTEFRLIR